MWAQQGKWAAQSMLSFSWMVQGAMVELWPQRAPAISRNLANFIKLTPPSYEATQGLECTDDIKYEKGRYR